jgi:hypothetical protein
MSTCPHTEYTLYRHAHQLVCIHGSKDPKPNEGFVDLQGAFRYPLRARKVKT